MIIEKCYLGDQLIGTWFEVPESHVRDYLSDNYSDVDAAMEEIRAGHTVQTRWTMYRRRGDNNEHGIHRVRQ